MAGKQLTLKQLRDMTFKPFRSKNRWYKARSKSEYDKKAMSQPCQLNETLAMPGIKAVRYVGSVVGNSGTYRCSIIFMNVEFQEEQPKNKRAWGQAPDSTGKMRWFKLPSVAKNPVQLKSEDQDFRFVWEMALFKQKMLIGMWRKYKLPSIPDKPTYTVTGASGTYKRFTPAPPEGRDFRESLTPGYSYPIHCLTGFLLRNDLVAS